MRVARLQAGDILLDEPDKSPEFKKSVFVERMRHLSGTSCQHLPLVDQTLGRAEQQCCRGFELSVERRALQ